MLARPRMLVCAVVVVVVLLLPLAHVTAAPPVAGPDAYADAVDPSSSVAVLNAAEAVGVPDGQSATVVSLIAGGLVLDLGADEEGTGDLVLTYATPEVQVVLEVAFLDAARQVIATAPLTLAQVSLGTATVSVPYATAPTPYRFVRLPAVAGVYSIDAIAAQTFRPDSDGDGLPDTWELQYQFNPRDASGVNGAGGDPDVDGLSNAQEYAAGTHPRVADTDGDGLPDGWEVQNGLAPTDATGANGADGDPDGDGLSNAQELELGTNPTVRDLDSDGDGLPDTWETRYGLNPRDATGANGAAGDPDGDGLSNLQELQAGTNPRVADTDGDGLPDGWELRYGLDPLDATGPNGGAGDPDGDGRSNADEYAAGTNPTAVGTRVFVAIVTR